MEHNMKSRNYPAHIRPNEFDTDTDYNSMGKEKPSQQIVLDLLDTHVFLNVLIHNLYCA